MATRWRQAWIKGTEAICHHRKLEEIRSGGGTLLAEMCRLCGLRVAEYGRCDGCDRERRLVYFVASKRTRYCSEDCKRQADARAREAKEAAEAAAATKRMAAAAGGERR